MRLEKLRRDPCPSCVTQRKIECCEQVSYQEPSKHDQAFLVPGDVFFVLSEKAKISRLWPLSRCFFSLSIRPSTTLTDCSITANGNVLSTPA